MAQWDEISGEDRGANYVARFARLAAQGRDVHGEASFCARLIPAGSRVLDAGCGTGRVAIRLDELGYHCVGVDVDAVMLAQARRAAPEVDWIEADLAAYSPGPAGFDLVVSAGNVLPLLEPGTEQLVIANLAATLKDGGALVTGFGLDAAHLPIAEAPFGLDEYDRWCEQASLVLVARYAGWDAAPFEGGGYAVSVHRLG